MKKILISIFLVSIFIPVSLPCFAAAPSRLAQVDTGAGSEITGMLNSAGKSSKLSSRDPRQTMAYIIYSVLTLLGIVFVVLVTYAGFLWLTAGGEEEQIKKAKAFITNGVIGIAIVLSAYGITRLGFNY